MGHCYNTKLMNRENKNELNFFGIEVGDEILLYEQDIDNYKITQESLGCYSLKARLKNVTCLDKIHTNKKEKKKSREVRYRIKENKQGKLVLVRIAK